MGDHARHAEGRRKGRGDPRQGHALTWWTLGDCGGCWLADGTCPPNRESGDDVPRAAWLDGVEAASGLLVGAIGPRDRDRFLQGLLGLDMIRLRGSAPRPA